ncbi:ester cyclase, partial [Paracoccus sp. PXZ]
MVFSEGRLGAFADLPAPNATSEGQAPATLFVDRLIDAWSRAWGQGETVAFENIAAATYVRYSRDGKQVRLPDMLRQIEESHSAFSDFRVSVNHTVAEGDMIAIEWRTVAKHTGSFMGVPPTQRDVVVSGASFLRHKDGRILEEWVAWDPRDLLAS